MKIRFDYYTADRGAAVLAFAKASDANATELSLSLCTYSCTPHWNLCGEIDHKDMAPFFKVVEDSGVFSSDCP